MAVIVSYMVDIAHFLIGRHIKPYTSVQEYVRATKMYRESTWGTNTLTGIDLLLVRWTCRWMMRIRHEC